MLHREPIYSQGGRLTWLKQMTTDTYDNENLTMYAFPRLQFPWLIFNFNSVFACGGTHVSSDSLATNTFACSCFLEEKRQREESKSTTDVHQADYINGLNKSALVCRHMLEIRLLCKHSGTNILDDVIVQRSSCCVYIHNRVKV